MSGIARGLTVAVVLCLPASVLGHGLLGRPRLVVAYYPTSPGYPMPVAVSEIALPAGVYVVPLLPVDCPPPTPRLVPTPLPGTAPANPTWAPATPAPPSAGPLPPVPTAQPTTPNTAPPPIAPQTPPPPTAPKLPALPPPPGMPQAAVQESHSSTNTFDMYSVPPDKGIKPTADRCSVGFWNLTGKELTLKIDGQTRTVAAGKSLTLDLARQFVWQVMGREAQNSTVPTADLGVEIVIRR
jgi:hypothetical protein